MAYYGGPGPLTALLNTAIKAGGGILGEFVGQKLLQKRLEDMFAKQTEVGAVLPLLQGRSSEEYQKIAPAIEQKLQEQGLFKTGLPKLTEQIGSKLPTGGEMVTSAEQLQPINKTTYIQPKENMKDIIAREGADWFGTLPPEEKSSVLRAAIAPKDLSTMIALMGMQQKGTTQAETQRHNLATESNAEAGMQVQILKLQEQINKSKETNRRLTSLEDLSARNRLDKLIDGMNLLIKSGDLEGAQRSIEQANSLIQSHPNLGIEPYQIEPPTGWRSWLPGAKPKIVGGKAKTPTAVPSGPTNFPDPSKLVEGQTGTDTTTGKRWIVKQGSWVELQ